MSATAAATSPTWSTWSRCVAEAGRLPGVAVARNEVFMCSDPGQNLIIEDIKNEGLNRVVVASCSPKLHESTFRAALVRAGLNPYLYENVNIREQVSWATHDPARSDGQGHGFDQGGSGEGRTL